MKKTFLAALVTGLLLLSCHKTPNIPTQTGENNYPEPVKEYTPFTTSALTESYIVRKISRWVDDNNGLNLVKELDYARYKYFNSIKNAIQNSDNPKELYSRIIAFPVIQARMSIDSSFDFFIKSIEPELNRVSTFAGDGNFGFADGPAANAEFTFTGGITIDRSGNVYVTDYYNHRVRKIDKSGIVSTVAGDGTDGHEDGQGTNSKIHGPDGITIDREGNLYFAEFSGCWIRKIDTGGYVSTIAGDGTNGYLDETGTNARFNGPSGITVDNSGNIYVGDYYNNTIRKIDSQGVVTTIAGNGNQGTEDGDGSSAGFYGPNSLAIDKDGNIYVAEHFSSLIRKIANNPSHTVTTVAGSSEGFADGNGTNALFNGPNGVAVDNLGNIFVADSGNNSIRKVNSTGEVTTIAGDGNAGDSDGPLTSARFNLPYQVAIDMFGNLYVSDAGNSKIRKIK
jgi:sugar lactone lactonase YvrE